MADEAIDRLIAAVAAHYEDSSRPLLLSRLGKLHPELREELVATFGSVGKAITAAGPERLQIIALPGVHGREVVVPPRLAAEMTRRVFEDTNPSLVLHALNRVPRPIQIAFCLKTDPGERVAVTLQTPARYERVPAGEGAPPGYLIVPDEYRFPDLQLSKATTEQRDQLWGRISTWIGLHHLDTDKIWPATTAYERFVAMQDPTVLPKIRLSPDIVSILLKNA